MPLDGKRKRSSDSQTPKPKIRCVGSQIVHLQTGASDLFPGDDKLPVIDAANDKLLNRLGVFEGQESRWTLQNVEKLDLDIARFNSIRGSSFIPSPDRIKKTHCW